MRRKIAVFLAPVLRSRWLAPSAAVLTAAALIGASFLLSGGPAPSATPLGQRLELDGDGRLTQSIDAAGRVTRLTVGGDGRSRSWDLPDGSKITEEFDEFGRRQAMTDAAGAVHYDHDGFNRLVAVRRDGMPALKFDYDGRGRLKSLDAGGQVVHYQYDFLGRLAAMETPAGAFTFEYPTGDDGGSSIVCRYPNGIRGERRFGPDGRLHVIAYVGADGGSLAEFTYAYRPDGLIGEVRERWPSGERTTSYVYDEVQRLASVVDDRGTTAYHYDLVGDRVEVLGPDKASAASRFDWAGRMLEHRGERCEQDAAGNLTSWAGAAGRARVRFNEENALAEVQADGGPVRYGYDGMGGLLTRTSGISKTTFLVDPRDRAWRPLLANADGGERTLYLWSGASPVAAQTGGRAEFYLTDHLGSVRAVTDARGALVRRADYDAFGAPRQAPEGQALQPGFAGLFYDPQAALYLTQARAYEPTLGRFLQRDPIHRIPMDSQQGLSAYVYCGNDPVNYLDSNGAESRAAAKLDSFVNWWDDYFTKQAEEAAEVLREASPIEKPFVASALLTASCLTDLRGLYRWAKLPLSANPVTRNVTELGEAAFLNAVAWDPESTDEEKMDVLKDAGKKLVLGRAGKALKGMAKDELPYDPVAPPDPGEEELLEKSLERAENVNELVEPSFDLLKYYRGGERETLRARGRERGSGPSSSLPPPAFVPPSFMPTITPPAVPFPAPIDSSPLLDKVREMAKPPSDDSKGEDTKRLTMIDPGPKTPADKTGTSRYVYDENAEKYPPVKDGKVGGVRLRGAGAALKDLGPLTGVAVDDNGRLVLLAADAPDVHLPPLRLDDIVTVFRCVYDHGEAPSVSIDPDPADEEGVRVHTVRHGKGTEDTYVGWVLFEADRVMKSYVVGMDTITKDRVHSRVPGYMDKMDLAFYYWDEESGRGSSRYRNWIVPAEVVRKRSGDRRLTLLDVPLKVRTERTAVRDGKLVDAPELGRSKSALAFVDWFSKNYDEIAKEAYSLPPRESGIDHPAPVFEELRRVALMSAVAEALHDQGAPFPAWMRDYPVRPCPTPRTTPPARREESRKVGGETRSWSIWGGVELAPIDEAKKTVDDAREANALAPAVFRAVAAAPTLEPVAFTQEGKKYHAVALPGDDTIEPGAAVLDVVDLAVPVGRGGSLRLTRHANSFFDPSDCLGKAWTLDLPRLEAYTQVTQRTEKTVFTKSRWRLTSPLETVSMDFNDATPVRPSPFQYITVFETDERIGARTQRLLFRDGRRWHFTEDGLLAAVEEAPFLQVFRRDDKGRVQALEGWLGKERRAQIALEYDAQGRLARAAGGGVEVRYDYDADGCLIGVQRPDGLIGYRYKDGLVAAILRDGKAVREFDYGDGGRLQAERGPDGAQFDYRFTPGPDGLKATVARTGKDGAGAEVVYDDGGRVRSRRWPDGSQLTFNHNAAGDVEATLTAPGGVSLSLTRSADGRRQELRTPQGGEVRSEYDAAGRPTALFVGADPVLKLAYRTDGQLESASDAGTQVRPLYSGDLRTGVVISAPPEAGKDADWLQIDCDADGRPVKVTGPHGTPASIAYDDKGRLESLRGPGGELRVARDAAGRVTSLTGPRGARWENTFDADGRLTRVEAARGPNPNVVEFDGALPSVVRRFDGGETRLAYEPAGEGRRLRSVRAANGLELTYEYDGSGRLTAVNCGPIYRMEYTYDAGGRLVGWAQRPAGSAAGPWK